MCMTFVLWGQLKQEVDVNIQHIMEALRIEIWNDILEIVEDKLHCILQNLLQQDK
jgi:hypothetical protein